MKSIHIAWTAIAATAATFGGIAALTGATDGLVGLAFDRALAGQQAISRTAVHGPDSEHFWLSQTDAHVKPALAPDTNAIPMADLKQAIVTAGAYEANALEIVDVQSVARASVSSPSAVGRSLLVTARLAATTRQPARLVKFVIDVGTATASSLPARAL
mgnify:FL=1